MITVPSAFPVCEAVIVHVPAATVLAVEPDTVHTDGVSEVNETGKPDDADADRGAGTRPSRAAAART